MAPGMAHRVEDLDTWKLCNQLVERVQAATEKAPASKDFRFCDQINDAAGDALSDMAEGFARFYPTDHANFLGYAIASLEEVRTRAAVGDTRK
jgi:four helix bundle protein